MSKSLLKLHLVCAEFDLKAQPDTLAHWSLIGISVLTRYERRGDMARSDSASGFIEEPGLHGCGPVSSCSY